FHVTGVQTCALPISNTLPLGNIDAYMAQVNQFPLLSETEENLLALQWYEKADMLAAKQLVLTHLRYVVSIAKRYRGYGLALSDRSEESRVRQQCGGS